MEKISHSSGAPQPLTIEEFIVQQQASSLLRFITCGSVDDGKSTLLGRLLWETRQLFDDQLATLKTESKKYGTQGDNIDFALLVDGLSAEREQGITIDVAYRFFSTAKRKFIAADTPGHEQYTRNMVTGASTAEVAILLVDARAGLQSQTRRHAYLVSLMGIQHVVLAINKMDTVDYSESVCLAIQEEFERYAKKLTFASVTTIPMSALKGDNITERSRHMTWYHGPTLIGYLETVEYVQTGSSRFVFPVQLVNRPDSSFRGFSGTVVQGRARVGDEIRVASSGQTAHIAEIITMDGSLAEVNSGQAVTVCLDREIDVSRGDVLSPSQDPVETTNQFEATVVWMHEDPGMAGRTYDLKLATQWVPASITKIKHRVNVSRLTHEVATTLTLNDISVCNLATTRPVVFDSYPACKQLGSFILVDRFTNATVAVGMITHSLRRAQNIHKQALVVTRQHREQLNGHKGKVIWFTGLSGSGKSTLASALEVALHDEGRRTYILDGDNVRHGLNKDLGFTDADRVENIRRVAEVARMMMDAGLIVITAFISPFARERDMARHLIGDENFFEVYVSTPLQECERRDVRGLYKKARNGEIPNMSGINSSYDIPLHSDFIADTVNDSVGEIIEKLKGKVGSPGISGQALARE
ncbi:MAG: sulfate adenylyltransferase subunit CysN [Telluria sp.]